MIAVPADHAALRRRDPALGSEWREASSRAFQSCFRAGLVGAWITEAREYVFVPADEALA